MPQRFCKNTHSDIRYEMICIAMNYVYCIRDTWRRVWCIKCSTALQTRISWSNALLKENQHCIGLSPSRCTIIPPCPEMQSEEKGEVTFHLVLVSCTQFHSPPRLSSCNFSAAIAAPPSIRDFLPPNHSTTSSPSWSQSFMCFLRLLACRGIHSQCPQLRNLGQ